MIRSLFFDQNQNVHYNLHPSTYAALLQEPGGLLWVDFENSPTGEDGPILLEIFKFHPLAVDDALKQSHVPRVDDWDTYLFIVLHAVSFHEGSDDIIETKELDIFLGPNYIVTHHDKKIEAVDQVFDIASKQERLLKGGPDHLLYRLVDEVVATFMPVVEDIDSAIDVVENEIFNHPTSRTLESIFRFKRAALHLRRIIGPEREVLNRLARDDYAVIDPDDQIYFRDVYDHLVRLYDIIDNIRDLISGTLDTYLSVINNRMNDIMKTLTVITTLFMPISFVVGFFGMNFFVPEVPLSEWVEKPVFYLTLAVLMGLPIGMFIWMRQRKWM